VIIRTRIGDYSYPYWGLFVPSSGIIRTRIGDYSYPHR
jgi:hypothetical protein